MGNNTRCKKMKIISIVPIKNQIELQCLETNEIYYFKLFANQIAQSQLAIGDLLAIQGQRFQVLNKKSMLNIN